MQRKTFFIFFFLMHQDRRQEEMKKKGLSTGIFILVGRFVDFSGLE